MHSFLETLCISFNVFCFLRVYLGHDFYINNRPMLRRYRLIRSAIIEVVITLSSNIAKLFELCLIEYHGSYLYLSDLQFGFKERNGFNSAIYTLLDDRSFIVNVGVLDIKSR